MPNWVFNTITITGNKDSLKRFMADAEKHDDEYYLSSWMPTPETFTKYDTANHPNGEKLKVGENWYDGLGDHNQTITEELIEEFKRATEEQREKYGVVGWYDYYVKTFGCKWDCEVNVIRCTDDEIMLTTDTPWRAPEKWLTKLSERYKDLTFGLHSEYEDGFWWIGEYTNGQEHELESGEDECEEED
jgi:hypothetical protein